VWIARDRYEALIRADERAEMLRIRVNQLEGDLAHERHLRSGEPQRVATLMNPRPKPEATTEEQSIAQIEMGLEIFEDAGDVRAEKLGLNFEGSQVQL
jgi:hypothetical protein